VPIWTVPYRALYSRNIDNLLMAGRCMSVTHIALGSARVQNTLATCGQAAGTAAALSVQLRTTPRGIYDRHLKALQQKLLKDDQTIPGIRNEDPHDLARKATATASSAMRHQTHARSEARGDLHALTTPRAVMFPTGTDKRLDTVHLRLKNDSAEPIEVTAFLRAAQSSGEFTSTRDVARATATVPAQSEDWIAFPFRATVDAPFAWVRLPPTEALNWRLMGNSPAGSCRAYGGGKDRAWTVVKNQYYGFYCTPALKLQVEGFDAANVINGWSRIVGKSPNMWASDPAQKLPQWIELTWRRPQRINVVYLTFDTNLNPKWATIPMPPECVRDYEVSAHNGTAWTTLATAKGNFLRRRVHRFDAVDATKLRLTVHATNGAREARVFEIRAYNEQD
jgi:hypothetical protein